MAPSGERDRGEPGMPPRGQEASERAPAGEREVAAWLAEAGRTIEEARRDERHMRRLLAGVAATEKGVAGTFREMAAIAARGGRPQDAERLTRYAEMAEAAAERARTESARRPPGGSDVTGPVQRGR